MASDPGHVRATMATHWLAVEGRLATENPLRHRLVHLIDALFEPRNQRGRYPRPPRRPGGHDHVKTTINRRISILVYDDIEAAHDYLIRVFRFGPGEVMRDPDGNVVHAEIQAGDGEFWLHAESAEFDLRSPKHLGGSSSTMAVMVDDVDAHHAHAVEQGATISYEPVDQPYGYREYSAVDPEGHLWSFMKPLT